MQARACSGVRWARLLAAATALGLIAYGAATAQQSAYSPAQLREHDTELSAGKILVANRKLLDPNFAQTVILLVKFGDEGGAGLIVNRQTKVQLSRLSREIEGTKGRSDPLYMGGPVAISGMMALLKNRVKPEGATSVFSDIHVITTKAGLEKAVASGAAPDSFRMYLGYAGWAAEQLESEIEMGAWDVIPPNAGIVFDPHPETLWSRLAGQQNMQVAIDYQRTRIYGTSRVSPQLTLILRP